MIITMEVIVFVSLLVTSASIKIVSFFFFVQSCVYVREYLWKYRFSESGVWLRDHLSAVLSKFRFRICFIIVQ